MQARTSAAMARGIFSAAKITVAAIPMIVRRELVTSHLLVGRAAALRRDAGWSARR